MCFRNLIAVLSLVALPMAAADSYSLPAGSEAAAKSISADRLRAHVAFLSDDLLEGRGPASRGDELARRYIATQMMELGLEPGMPDGSWQQRFGLVGVNATVPGTWSFTGPKRNEATFKNST
ncbi:MAG: peptidase M28, partial [Acidobacteria bacterium]|nr:peptidase M28 [Acidobacteriota bacterium]